jgi:hypothetical protein
MIRRKWWHARHPIWRHVLHVAAWVGLILAFLILAGSSLLTVVKVLK